MAIEKSRVARKFSLSASRYDQNAKVQNEIGDRLLESIPADVRGTLVDLGCGTGRLLKKLQAENRFQLTGVDFAPGMIDIARQQTTAALSLADIEATRLPANSFDIAISNAAIQWCRLELAFREAFRILKPTGHFLFTTFGPETLIHWRKAWNETMPESHSRIHDFADQPTVVSTLKQVGFVDVKIQQRVVDAFFDDVREMLDSVRKLGASFSGEKNSYMGKEAYKQFMQNLKSTSQLDGQLASTYEVYFVSCQKPS